MSERQRRKREMKGLFARPSSPETQPTIDTRGFKQGDWVVLNEDTPISGAKGQIVGFEATLAGTLAHVRFDLNSQPLPVLVTGLKTKETASKKESLSEEARKLTDWILEEFEKIKSNTNPETINHELTFVTARILNTIELINRRCSGIPPEESLKIIKEFEVYPNPKIICRFRESEDKPPYFDVRFTR
jgi:hypothetical protein